MVALVGDSFAFGIVPHTLNFTRVAEDALRSRRGASVGRIAIHNFGISAIGLPEYELLLADEVPVFEPGLAIVALFPSNDLATAIPARRRPYNPREWRSVELSRRAFALVRASSRAPKADPEPASITSEEEWVEGNLPTHSEEEFIRIESLIWRALDPNNPRTQRQLDSLLDRLERMRRRAPFPLAIVVIPDEAQVSDRLRDEVLATHPELERIDRSAVYRALVETLRRHDFPILDLLPVLRAAERSATTHHFRDTHWNTYGNRIVGLELAGFIEDIWAADAPVED